MHFVPVNYRAVYQKTGVRESVDPVLATADTYTMHGDVKKLLAVVLFTVALIVVVNVTWWLFYDRSERLLDRQLSRRLSAIASTTVLTIDPVSIKLIFKGDFEIYAELTAFLERTRSTDTLSEIFIVDDTYRYLTTTAITSDSTYFLAELNSPYIDSLLYGFADHTIVTPSYRTGQVYLKSAFAPIYDSLGSVLAVLGVEADVDYFDSLADLRHNLYLFTGLSLVGGILLGIIFLLVQRKLNCVQQQLFLTETHAYLGRMVAMVSHEIKNPLMIIRAAAERLTKKLNTSDEAAVGATNEGVYIVEEVDRLNGIVTGYLSYAAGAGSYLIDTQPETIDLNDLLAGLRAHFAAKYPDDEVLWLEGDTMPDIEMKGYRQALRQVLLNLLINGADACREAGRTIRVGITASATNGSVEIRVIDSGVGMSPQQVKRAFEPFYSTKQMGSGLGLHLSKKIVEEMGGTIILRSKPKQGTTVVIDLPKHPSE